MTTPTTTKLQHRRPTMIAAMMTLSLMVMFALATSAARPLLADQPAVEFAIRTGAALRGNHILYDPQRDRLYVSVPGGQGARSNSITVFHRDGRVGESLPMGSEPGVMAISADSQILYVGLDDAGAVVGVDLDTMTVGQPWLLGQDATCGRFVAADMVVMQNEPQVVAVARNNPCVSNGAGPIHAGVAVYADGIRRPDTTDAARRNNAIEPTDDNSFLIGLDRESAGRTLRVLAVGVDGVVEIDAVDGLLSPDAADIRTIDWRTYATSGDVVDPIGMANVGQFAVENNSLPVARGGRAFFLQYNSSATQYELHIFDANTMTLLAWTPITGLDDAQPDNGVEFLDTGPDSMAIRLGDGDVVWLQVRLFQYSSYLPAVGRGLPVVAVRNERNAD